MAIRTNSDLNSNQPILLNTENFTEKITLDIASEAKFLECVEIYNEDISEYSTYEVNSEISKDIQLAFNSSETVKNLLSDFLQSLTPFVEKKLMQV